MSAPRKRRSPIHKFTCGLLAFGIVCALLSLTDILAPLPALVALLVGFLVILVGEFDENPFRLRD